MHPRHAENRILLALRDTPAVMVVGPRQCGKTTLVKDIANSQYTYITLDDTNQLQLAKNDPISFIQKFDNQNVIIDEIQRAPELFLPIKKSIDENRLPGRFLLTGSANAMTLPQVADSLAGRLETIHLLPLAQCEITHTKSTFLDNILSTKLPETKQRITRDELINKVLAGGFPEPLARQDITRRNNWFRQYISSIVQKDIKSLSQIENLDTMHRLIQILANHVSQLINYTEIANALSLSRQTVTRYTSLLSQLFIFEELPAWNRNDNKRLIKSPKVHIVDSGLLCALKRINPTKLEENPHLLGNILESYVLNELHKLASWRDEPIYFSHYRDKDKVEVDIVLETLDGDVIGIEVKASATLRKEHFHGLQKLKQAAGKQFKVGVLLYNGEHSNIVEDNIIAAPISALWE